MLEVCRSVTIRRPLQEVRSQFGDVAYHERQTPHPGVDFRVIEDSAQGCEYEQVTRIGPFRLCQHFRLDRADPGHQVNELLAGVFAPGSITFDVTAVGDDAAQVTATLRTERGGLTRVAAPFLRRVLERALGRGLGEDRDDLESGKYATTHPSADPQPAPTQPTGSG